METSWAAAKNSRSLRRRGVPVSASIRIQTSRSSAIWTISSFQMLQEYARHVGRLDMVRELADGATGE